MNRWSRRSGRGVACESAGRRLSRIPASPCRARRRRACRRRRCSGRLLRIEARPGRQARAVRISGGGEVDPVARPSCRTARGRLVPPRPGPRIERLEHVRNFGGVERADVAREIAAVADDRLRRSVVEMIEIDARAAGLACMLAQVQFSQLNTRVPMTLRLGLLRLGVRACRECRRKASAMSPYSARARRLNSASVGIGGWVEPSSAVAPVSSGTSFCAPRAKCSISARA